MEKLIDKLSAVMADAFTSAGYPADFAKVGVSNRPDLCEFQCNGAMPAAKAARKAPIMIANEVAEKLKAQDIFSSVEAVNPGFINLRVSPAYLAAHVDEMSRTEHRALPVK